jgi:hypothetical protein
MKAITQDYKTIVVFDGEKETGRLVYHGRFSSRADIVDVDKQVFAILPVNIWRTAYEVRQGEKSILSFNRSWKGSTRIQTFFGSSDEEYTFRRKGIFHRRLLLLDKDDREMLVVKTEFIWKKFRYDYNIEVSESMKRRQHFQLLTTLMVYLCREYLSRQASRGTAAA